MTENNSVFADKTTLSIVCDLSSLPIVCWQQGASAQSICAFGIENITDYPCIVDADLRSMLEESVNGWNAPVLFFENEFVFYGVFCVGNEYLCLGPAARIHVTAQFEDQYAASHGSKRTIRLEKYDTGTLAKYLALLFNRYTGRAVSYDDFTIRGHDFSIDDWQREGALEHYQLSQSEYDRAHMSGIDFENELVAIVNRGDIDAVKKLMVGEMPNIEEVGAVASSQRKQSEYLTVSLLTLLTRAAIEGGANSEKAHELGDVFLKELEAASNHGDAYAMIGFRAMYDFTELVKTTKEQKSSRSYIIDACKDHVAKNLRKNLEVGDIAPAIGVSRTYLAHKFKESEGITLQQYIQRERCRHAANLLRFSNYSIALISEYMCFSSQSYFGSCFKHWYGITPKEYRLQNQRI